MAYRKSSRSRSTVSRGGRRAGSSRGRSGSTRRAPARRGSVSARRVSSTSRIRIEVVGVPQEALAAARPAVQGLTQTVQKKARKRAF